MRMLARAVLRGEMCWVCVSAFGELILVVRFVPSFELMSIPTIVPWRPNWKTAKTVECRPSCSAKGRILPGSIGCPRRRLCPAQPPSAPAPWPLAAAPNGVPLRQVYYSAGPVRHQHQGSPHKTPAIEPAVVVPYGLIVKSSPSRNTRNDPEEAQAKAFLTALTALLPARCLARFCGPPQTPLHLRRLSGSAAPVPTRPGHRVRVPHCCVSHFCNGPPDTACGATVAVHASTWS